MNGNWVIVRSVSFSSRTVHLLTAKLANDFLATNCSEFIHKDHQTHAIALFCWWPSRKYVTLVGYGVCEGVTVCDRGRGSKEYVTSHFAKKNTKHTRS